MRFGTGRLLVVAAVAAGFSLAFLGVMALVLTGAAAGFDRAVLLALRDPLDPDQPGGPWWLARMARDLTALGSVTVLGLITLLAFGALLVMRRWVAALSLLLAVGGGTAVSSTLKALIGRARPDLVPHGDAVLSASFPSGHAMLSMVVGLSVGALLAHEIADRRLRVYVMAVVLGLSLTIGASRVYLGVHWPTDVLAGWLIGGSWAALCWCIADERIALAGRHQTAAAARSVAGDPA